MIQIRAHRRCVRCGSPIPPSLIHCELCKKSIKLSYDREYRRKQREKKKEIMAAINDYTRNEYNYIDDDGYTCIDETHNGWDSFGKIKFLGTVSEWDLDRRIWKLKQKLKNDD